MTNPDHPLTSRVMVNRIWKHHFGAGISRDALGNFGKTGTPPTHPELLDWLATEFIRQGWSMKQMHRLMMTSSAYRQESRERQHRIEAGRSREHASLAHAYAQNGCRKPERYDAPGVGPARRDSLRTPAPVEVREDGLVTPIETRRDSGAASTSGSGGQS